MEDPTGHSRGEYPRDRAAVPMLLQEGRLPAALQEPLKVSLNDDGGVEPLSLFSLAPPAILKPKPAAESLADENTALAAANAQLARENAMLRMQKMWRSPHLPPDVLAYPGAPESTLPWAVANVWGAKQPWSQGYMSSVPHPHRQRGSGFNNPKGNPGSWSDMEKRFSATSSFGSASTMTGTAVTATNSFASMTEEHLDAESHSVVPKGSKEPPILTTVMMRNIPNNYTRDALLRLMNEEGFECRYNLVYLPVDFKNKVGLGYAFINLCTAVDAEAFRQHFQGFCKWSMQSEKVCEVSWSDALQGVNAHIERYRNSPVMHESVPDECKPVLFQDGQRISFPEPTKRIRAPRQWPRRH